MHLTQFRSDAALLPFETNVLYIEHAGASGGCALAAISHALMMHPDFHGVHLATGAAPTMSRLNTLLQARIGMAFWVSLTWWKCNF